jgi:hypothetical protein
MKIVTGATRDFENYVKRLRKDIDRLGYELKVYDYDGEVDGEYFPLDFIKPNKEELYRAKIPMKPFIILDMLYKTGEPFVYMDCDVEILEDFSEVMTSDYDIGVCIHKKKYHDGSVMNNPYPNISGYLNAGIIYVNNTSNTKYFIRKWLMSYVGSEKGSDQEALTRLMEGCSWEPYDIHVIDGIRIKMFPSEIYNFTFLKEEDMKEAKVLHYVGMNRPKLNEKCVGL